MWPDAGMGRVQVQGTVRRLAPDGTLGCVFREADRRDPDQARAPNARAATRTSRRTAGSLMVSAPSKAPVTMRALIQRINRSLAEQNEVVKAPRGAARDELGAFYRVDLKANQVNEKHVDPE